jgi:CRP/FNR family cyclic AMP-dependent transcriptional regulator
MKANSRIIEALRRIPGLAGCSDRELGKIAAHLAYGAVQSGDILTRQDRVARQGYLIIAGEAVARRDGVVVGRLGPGELVGEMALLEGIVRSATVAAETAMELFVFDTSEFSRLMDEPAFAKLVARQLSTRLRDSDARVGQTTAT